MLLNRLGRRIEYDCFEKYSVKSLNYFIISKPRQDSKINFSEHDEQGTKQAI